MFPFAEGLVWLACCSILPPGAAPAPADSALRTFVVEKAPAPPEADGTDYVRATRGLNTTAPSAHGLLRSTIGVGYVQHAGWGVEALAAGAVGGLELQLDSLFTFGAEGPLFDHGTIMLRRADQPWLAEAGDLFSDLRGPSRGIRVSWQVTDRWRPTLAVYAPPRRMGSQNTVLVYRDRIDFERLSVSGELGSDASHFLRTRVTAGRRFDLEASYRRVLQPVPARDAGVQAEVRLWRGVSFSAGVFRSDRPGDRSTWETIAAHVPLHRYFGLTLERTFTTTTAMRSASSAVMVDVHANQFMFLQRYEWGGTRQLQPGMPAGVDRDALHSMASYTVGPRLNVGMRVATQWSPTAPPQSWLEAQATVRLASKTILQIAAPMPQPLDADRARVTLEQGLPRHFSIFAEYGRPAAYQDIQDATEQPRFKLLLRRDFDVATPASGGLVSGLVLDYVGRPVPGARVRLGPYSADSDLRGAYVFAHVPRGDFELSLDPDLLPADYAWDGRALRVTVQPSSHIVIDLVVAPLNAIHGRVYVDRDGNGRFDAGEGVTGAVLVLGDRVTATGSDGAYDFYNVMPGRHVVRLDLTRLPAPFAFTGTPELDIDLREDRPVTRADFLVAAKTKSIIWKDGR